MANVYDASIYAKFYNEKQRDDWLMEHGINQSIPKGGPVTSYSTEYEAHYRDLVIELADALEELVNYNGGADNALEDKYVMERVREALTKAGR